LDGRRALDLAEGILIGRRHYSVEAAFDELLTVACRHHLSVSTTAAALVALATGDSGAAGVDPSAAAAVRVEWAQLVHPSAVSSGVPVWENNASTHVPLTEVGV
jgi:hypothetical protein